MKKFLLVMAVFFCLTGAAFADSRVDMVRYKCTDCGKEFYTFKGDSDLTNKKFHDDKYQLSHLFRFDNRSHNLDSCKRNSKAHNFKRTGTTRFDISDLSRNLSKVIAVKDGPSLSIKLQEWYCKSDRKTFYSFSGENLNVRQKNRQQDNILSLHGRRPIARCSSKDKQHSFEKKRSRNIKSWELANLIDNIYWVK